MLKFLHLFLLISILFQISLSNKFCNEIKNWKIDKEIHELSENFEKFPNNKTICVRISRNDKSFMKILAEMNDGLESLICSKTFTIIFSRQIGNYGEYLNIIDNWCNEDLFKKVNDVKMNSLIVERSGKRGFVGLADTVFISKYHEQNKEDVASPKLIRITIAYSAFYLLGMLVSFVCLCCALKNKEEEEEEEEWYVWKRIRVFRR